MTFDLNPIKVDVFESSYSRGGGYNNPRIVKWPISQPFMVRFSKLFCLVKACDFYSISGFLSFIVLPLDIAKVTKVIPIRLVKTYENRH